MCLLEESVVVVFVVGVCEDEEEAEQTTRHRPVFMGEAEGGEARVGSDVGARNWITAAQQGLEQRSLPAKIEKPKKEDSEKGWTTVA